MNNIDLKTLITEALDYFDKQNLKYKKYIDSKKIINNEGVVTFYDDIKKKNLMEAKYEYLGFFYNKTKIWFWAWMHPLIKSTISQELLRYGLKIDSKIITDKPDNLFIKTQLINSRFLLGNYIHLEIHLALSSYLIKNRGIFVCPIKQVINKDDPDDYILEFIIIKK